MSEEPGGMTEQEKSIQNGLQALAEYERKMMAAENAVTAFHIEKMQPIFEERRSALKAIPGFWSTVFNQSEDFQEFPLGTEDNDIFDSIKEVYITKSVTGNSSRHGIDRIEITIEFGDSDILEDQVLVKKFWTEDIDVNTENGVSKKSIWVSEPVEVKFKEAALKDKKRLKPYKKGFLKWFEYKGKSHGEFKGGDDLAVLLAEDIFPAAATYFTESLADQEEDEDEEIDLSEEEDADEDDNEEDDDEKSQNGNADKESNKRVSGEQSNGSAKKQKVEEEATGK